MRRFLGLLPLAVLMVSGCTKTDAALPDALAATPPTPPIAPKAEKPMMPDSVNLKAATRAADSANAFGLDLFRTVAQEKPGENVFLSPTSLSLALGMAYSGSGGGTTAAMAKTLHLATDDIAGADAANGALQAALLGADPKVTVSVANALWADKAFTFRAAFAARCRANYGAPATSLSFSDPSSADSINTWCAQATNNLITQLVTPDDLHGAAGVLTNAVYFKGIWAAKFDKGRTADQPFHPEGAAEYPVPMMHLEKAFRYRGPLPAGDESRPALPGKPPVAPTDGPQIVKLPYGSGEWAMYAFLPTKGQGLSAFLSDFTDANWRKWRGEFQRAQVRLSLPRFKVEFESKMAGPLKALGMGEAFSDRADFAPMFNQNAAFYISDVIHKAVLKVNEESTEAAAATGVIMRGVSMPIAPPPVEMTFDRPFVCAIVHEPTGAIAFLGAFPHPDMNRD